jgi:hypothetical protein
VTAPRRDAPNPAVPEDDDARPNITGLVLIVAAVLIGVVLLLRGFDQEGGLIDTAGPEPGREATTVPGGPDDVPDEATTTTAPAVEPASVNVLVANASGGVGVAGRNETTLNEAGFTNTATANADVRNTSVVYYAEEAEAAAAAVAEALELPEASVQALPSPPPLDVGSATVVVLIGTDQA